MSIDKLKTKFTTGAWLPDMKQFYKKVNEIVDWINNIGSTSVPSYKIYTAFLTQTGTNAPVVTVLNNTLDGDIIWSYNDVGAYTGTLIGAFTIDKTVTIPLIEKYIYSDIAGDGNIRIAPNDINTVKIRTLDNTLVEANGILTNSPIEIRVYN